MANDESAGAAAPSSSSLWPTALGLMLFLFGGVFAVRSTESSMVTLMVALSSMLIAAAGTIGHGLVGLWRGLRGRFGPARGSFLRVALYLVFGIASFAAARFQGGSIDEVRGALRPGMSVHEALRQLDAFYASHPRRFRFVTLWGTQTERALEDYGQIERPEDGAVLFTWRAGETRSPEVLTQTAEALSRTRQVWITFRTDVGFIHFFLTLDAGGMVKSISGTTGHQA